MPPGVDRPSETSLPSGHQPTAKDLGQGWREAAQHSCLKTPLLGNPLDKAKHQHQVCTFRPRGPGFPVSPGASMLPH